MKRWRSSALVTAVASLALTGSAAVGFAQGDGSDSRYEVSVLGGVQGLNENDTAFPDNFINIPAVGIVTYQLTSLLAVEGDFTWMIPVQQQVTMATGESVDRKTPSILAYQAGLRARWPGLSWTPYLAAGAGAMTFLSNTAPDRVPQLSESQTAFAINFGAGAEFPLAPRWAVRADFREFAAFPQNDAAGLSSASQADPIWMERATVGFGYRF